jgi:uncharacterized membrane protein
MVILAALIGVVAGLRSLLAPAIVSWAAHAGWLHLNGTWLAFLGYRWTPWILSLAALAELVADKLPTTPSRKAPVGFILRIITGAVSGAAIGTSSTGFMWVGLIAGALGAVLGTFGGAAARYSLAKAAGKDFPIALLEDAVAIICGVLSVSHI